MYPRPSHRPSMCTVPSGQNGIRLLCLAALCLAMTACSVLTPAGARTTPSDPTPTDIPYGQCVWNWSTRPLSELSAQVQEALDAAGIERINATAEAFGEDCLDAKTGQVNRFAAMQTDFRFALRVDDLSDREALGILAGQVLDVLDGFPPERTPGPSSGQVGMSFETDGQALHLWFPLQQAQQAREQGLEGAALLEALEKLSF
jgi:hypothetical protein